MENSVMLSDSSSLRECISFGTKILMDYKDIILGIHGITSRDDYETKPEDKAESIIANGLVNSNWGGILSNVHIVGNYLNADFDEVMGYAYVIYDDEKNPNNKFGKKVNVIVGMPTIAKTSDGKEYFLGDFTDTDKVIEKGNEDLCDLPLNQMVEKDKLLPSPFIMGYIKSTCDKTEFVINPDYFGWQSREERTNFNDQLISALKEKEIPLLTLDEDGLKDAELMSKYRAFEGYVRQFKKTYEIKANKGKKFD